MDVVCVSESSRAAVTKHQVCVAEKQQFCRLGSPRSRGQRGGPSLLGPLPEADFSLYPHEDGASELSGALSYRC